MRGTTRSTRIAALALSAAIAGCEGGEGADRDERRDAATSERGDAAIWVSRTGKGCPGTRPSRTPPFPGEDFNYGNRYLGVAMWSNGRLAASRRGRSTWGQTMPDGTVYAKLGWFRGVPGRLTIRGERLDAPAPLCMLQCRPATAAAASRPPG